MADLRTSPAARGPFKGYPAGVVDRSGYFGSTGPRWGQVPALWGSQGTPDVYVRRWQERQAAPLAKAVGDTLGNLRGSWYPPAIRQRVGMLTRFGRFAVGLTPQGRAARFLFEAASFAWNQGLPTLEPVPGKLAGQPYSKPGTGPAKYAMPSGWYREMYCRDGKHDFLYHAVGSCLNGAAVDPLTPAQVDAQGALSINEFAGTIIGMWKAITLENWRKGPGAAPFTGEKIIPTTPALWPEDWPVQELPWHLLPKRVNGPFYRTWEPSSVQKPDLGRRLVIGPQTYTEPIGGNPSPYIRTLPRSRIVEKKFIMSPLMTAGRRFLSDVTEAGDVVDCFFNNLSSKTLKKIKREYGNKSKLTKEQVKWARDNDIKLLSDRGSGNAIPLWRKVEVILQRYEELDLVKNNKETGLPETGWTRAINCMVENEIEDRIIGQLSDLRKSNKALSEYFGGARTDLGLGPSL